MKEIWFTSDTHFNHENILKFESNKAEKRGDNFSSMNHMNEMLIQNWNALIKPEDKVYHLGDVIMGSKSDFGKILSRLNGKKRLVLGNHDDPKLLAPFFQKIMLWRNLKSLTLFVLIFR